MAAVDFARYIVSMSDLRLPVSLFWGSVNVDPPQVMSTHRARLFRPLLRVSSRESGA